MCVAVYVIACRLYNVNGFNLLFKFKGHLHRQLLIRASIFGGGGEDGAPVVVCGSEAGGVAVWRLPTSDDGRHKSTKVKDFELVSCVTKDGYSRKTVAVTPLAVLAPRRVLQRLGAVDGALLIVADTTGTIQIYSTGDMNNTT